MGKASGFTRRDFMESAAAMGALSLLPLGGCATASRSAERAPAQDEVVIRNAFVMTMDPARGDLADADVHVRDGQIVAVGRALPASGATAIDGRGMIVLPGLIETHWHMWNSLMRSMSADEAKYGYFPTARSLGIAYTAQDMYQGTRLAAAEAIHSGITFVHDWCHNIRSPEYAEQDLRALREAGIRARFSYGQAQGQSNDEPLNAADIERLQKNWRDYSNGGLISLGLAWRGVSTGGTGTVSAAAYSRDFNEARRLGIPISVHVNTSKANAGTILRLAKEGFLVRDMQLIHSTLVMPEELRLLAESGASVSVSPYTEMRIGFGLPPTGEFLSARIPLGLSVDTTALSGNADMFAIMKAIQNVENGRANNEFKITARRVLELATIEGARSMGVDKQVGSLVPGKRADLIMLNTREVNLGVFTDPAHMIVEAAQPANVDTVMVDGRVLKRHGKLTALDTARMMDEAQDALQSLRKRANWW